MYAKKIIAAFIALAILGTNMTMPNPLQQDAPLAGQISVQGESPVVARIGEVTAIAESDTITVRISGSDVLITASYLFPAYEPVLGDYVYVTKQDSQWFILGTMSGPIISAIPNPSFELGTTGTTPDSWTTTVIASPAGVPTFTKEISARPIAGAFQGMIRNQSAGVAGTSILDIFSTPVAAVEGQRWTMSFFLAYAIINVNGALVSQSGNTQVQVFIQFLDASLALISEESAYVLYLGSNVITPTYIRTVAASTQAAYAPAPNLTSFVRLRIRATLTMNANSATEIYLDQMVLRTPD